MGLLVWGRGPRSSNKVIGGQRTCCLVEHVVWDFVIDSSCGCEQLHGGGSLCQRWGLRFFFGVYTVDLKAWGFFGLWREVLVPARGGFTTVWDCRRGWVSSFSFLFFFLRFGLCYRWVRLNLMEFNLFWGFIWMIWRTGLQWFDDDVGGFCCFLVALLVLA